MRQAIWCCLVLFQKINDAIATEDNFIKTKFDGGIATRGCMFDIRAIQETYITSFDINANTGIHQMEIYTKTGSYVGYEIDSRESWNLVGNMTIEGNGPFRATTIPSDTFEHIWIAENETQGLFFLLDSDNLLLSKSDNMKINIGTRIAASSTLEIFRGIGVYEPFKYNLGYPIEWNGAIYYQHSNPNDLSKIEPTLYLSCGDEVFGTTLNQQQISAPTCDNIGNGRNGAVKYAFQENKNTHVSISLCNEGTNFDSKIRVFRENRNGNSNCVTSNDDFCGEKSQVNFYNMDGDSYVILIDGNDDAEGDFQLSIVCPTPLETVMTIDTLSCGSSVQGTTLSLPSVSAPSCGLSSIDHSISDGKRGSVKYSFKENKNGLVTMNLCENTDFDTQIRIYEKDAKEELICISANDDFCDLKSSVTFNHQADTEYFVVIDGHDDAEGSFSLDVKCPLPDIVTHFRQSFVMLKSTLSEKEKKHFELIISNISSEYIIHRFDAEVGTFVNVISQTGKEIEDGDRYFVSIEYLLSFSSHNMDVSGLPDIFIEHFDHRDNLLRFEDDLMFYGIVVIPGKTTKPTIYDPLYQNGEDFQQNQISNQKQILILIVGISFFATALVFFMYAQVQLWFKFSKPPDFELVSEIEDKFMS